MDSTPNHVTAQEVAAASGVSLTTVSYVLNGRDANMRIAPATAGRVREVAKRLGYRSNFLARSLATRRTGLIGMIFPEIAGSFAHQVLQGVVGEINPGGYDTLIGVNFWDKDRERREVEMMLDKKVEGIIALPLVGGEDAYRMAAEAGVPVVFICDWLPKLGFASVALDGCAAVRELVRHLHAIGRRRIHMIGVEWNSACLIEREVAFLDELERLGLPCDGSLIHSSRLGDEASIVRTVGTFAQEHPESDGLLCISDAIAFLAIPELHRLGRKVPKELALAGVGNFMFADHPNISLTTVDERRGEIGREAGRLLTGLIAAGGKRKSKKELSVRVAGNLVVRGSTAAESLQ